MNSFCSEATLWAQLIRFGTKEFIMFTRKRRLFIALLVIAAMMTSGVFTFAASSNVSIKNYKAPSSIKAGKSFSVKGTISSNTTIKRVEIGIAKSSGGWTSYKYDNKKVNSKSFNVKKADSKLKFGKLGAGTYYYRIYAHTSDGVCHTVLNKKFSVTGKSSSGNGASVSSMRYPGTITKGNGFIVKGKVKSSKKIKTITIGVTDSNGKWTSVKYTKKSINSKSYNLNKLDSKVKIRSLGVGNYNYRVDVSTTKGTRTLVNSSFAVVAPAPAPVAAQTNTTPVMESVTVTDPASGRADDVKLADDKSSTLVKSGTNTVELVGVSKPSNYTVGGNFTPAGTLKSSETIKRVEIGIIYAPTNKWTTYKYDNTAVNSNTFDLSNAASKLKFNKLPGGTFKYRVYVHTDSGVTVALNHGFTVTPSTKPQAAVNWAVQIANDNSFSYGAKPKTSKVGCYFCGTTKKNKPKGYEKTYVCLTFVHAAFAHGAGDPELLKECKAGKHCVSVSDSNFSNYSCWFKVGFTKDLTVADLQPGDVICYYSSTGYTNGHIVLYCGGNNTVDAQGIKDCWGPNSIAVHNNAAGVLKAATKHNSKSYVMRYIY